jgi:chorismate lyase / 3-hydroxybenzoate synthase
VTVASKSRTLASDPLTFRRLRLDCGAPAPQEFSNDEDLALAGRWLGNAPHALQAPLLDCEGAVLDTWRGQGQLKARKHGCVHYTNDGTWLHGCAEIDDRVVGLQRASERAYTELFEVLASSSCPHPLRLWNYIRDINVQTDGVERYRQFNAGRQEAFVQARRSAFEGAPAACALGTQGGALRVYFLAGAHAPLAIENPRQVSAYRYPLAYGPRSPTFSRAALVDVGGQRLALFISGTASIVGHETLHAGNVRLQTAESLTNITAVLDEAASRSGRSFAPSEMIYTVYVRSPGDLGIVREVFERFVGSNSPAARDAVYLQADICRCDLLVEIEAHGFTRTGGAN